MEAELREALERLRQEYSDTAIPMAAFVALVALVRAVDEELTDESRQDVREEALSFLREDTDSSLRTIAEQLLLAIFSPTSRRPR